MFRVCRRESKSSRLADSQTPLEAFGSFFISLIHRFSLPLFLSFLLLTIFHGFSSSPPPIPYYCFESRARITRFNLFFMQIYQIYIYPFHFALSFCSETILSMNEKGKTFPPMCFFCHAPETAVDTLFQVVKAPIFVSTSDTHAVKISKFFVLAFKLFFRKFRYNPVACSVCTKKKSSTMNIKPKETRSQNEDETKNEIHSFRV